MYEQLIDLAEWGTRNQRWFTAQLYGVYLLQKQPLHSCKILLVYHF
jgi:hypothetical protein